MTQTKADLIDKIEIEKELCENEFDKPQINVADSAPSSHLISQMIDEQIND